LTAKGRTDIRKQAKVRGWRPPSPPENAARPQGKWEVRGRRSGKPLEPDADGGRRSRYGRPSIYASASRYQGGDVLAVAHAYVRNPRRSRSASSNGYTERNAGVPLSKSFTGRCDLRLRFAQATRLRTLNIRRRKQVRVTSSTCVTSPARCELAPLGAGRYQRPGRLNVGREGPDVIRPQLAQAIARWGSAKGDEPEMRGPSTAPATFRHCYADTGLANELLGFRREIPFEAGCRSSASNGSKDRRGATDSSLRRVGDRGWRARLAAY